MSAADRDRSIPPKPAGERTRHARRDTLNGVRSAGLRAAIPRLHHGIAALLDARQTPMPGLTLGVAIILGLCVWHPAAFAWWWAGLPILGNATILRVFLVFLLSGAMLTFLDTVGRTWAAISGWSWRQFAAAAIWSAALVGIFVMAQPGIG